MSRVLPALAALVLTIYCVVDCVQTDESRVRNLPKLVWLLMILIFPVVGPVAWLLAGRERGAPAGTRQVRRAAPPSRPVAPDDDPRFLAGLDKTNEERRRLADWERELQAREKAVNDPAGEQATSPAPAPEDGADPDGSGDARPTRG